MKNFQVDGRISTEMKLLMSDPTNPNLESKETDSSKHNTWVFLFQEHWKKIFVTSCVFAVSLDPLFFYIPIINQDMKCLSLDNNLKIAALVLRSITDLFYIIDIFFRVYGSDNSHSPMTTLWFIIIDILAILPIPQVIVLVFFPKIRGSRSSNTRKLFNTGKLFINGFIMLQYVPRVMRIYQLFGELKTTRKKEAEERTATWVKGALNFFMYILASHVVGAIWYFFAIQRMVDCWQQACWNESGCKATVFGCHQEDHTSRNSTFLNDLCPINKPDTTQSGFGIFLNLLQSSIPESTDYLQKFSNCFWWGLRNLSSFGSNLQTSINTWENLFAAFISIIGLLLFLYLIGNLQTYMQLETARSEDHRYKMQISQKKKNKGVEIELWLYKNGIPKKSSKEIMPQIMEIVQQELEEKREVNVEKILSILPSKLQSQIESLFSLGSESSPLNILKKVPRLQKMDEKVLKAMCDYLKPESYTKGTCIVQKNGRLGVMLIITDGVVEIETNGNDANSKTKKVGTNEDLMLRKGDFYGEELLEWVNHMAFPTVLPLSTTTARVLSNVEALVINADDLNRVVSFFGPQYFSDSEFPVPKDATSRLGLDKLPFFRSALRIE